MLNKINKDQTIFIRDTKQCYYTIISCNMYVRKRSYEHIQCTCLICTPRIELILYDSMNKAIILSAGSE